MPADSFIPNSFQTPNAYVDRLMALLTSDEYKVLSYAARRIFGFQKRADRISLSQFAGGVVNKKTGERFDYGTGLQVDTCRRAVHALVTYGVLQELAPNDSHVNAGPLYTLQLDADRVDFAGLEARQAEQAERNTARTKAARQARQSGPPNVGHTPPCATIGGMSHNTTPLLSDNTTPPIVAQTPPPIVGHEHNNQGKPVENQGETAPPADSFDEITSARLARQAAQQERVAAARSAPPPEPCPQYNDLPAPVKAELVDMLAPYSDDPEPIVRRQVAWFRQGVRAERRLRAEWVAALRGVVQEEIDKRLPTGPARTKARAVVIPDVLSWN